MAMGNDLTETAREALQGILGDKRRLPTDEERDKALLILKAQGRDARLSVKAIAEAIRLHFAQEAPNGLSSW
ncbi:hypothetical protein [Thioclava kandeliae]|uniref:Uncharacterized protein n=1 Tax=Thioclava kandeliae TaxID=3070818 RepID=A0ABV1SGF4_9RHOB